MVSPDSLDLTDCPYMWPYCKQPLYHSAMPIIVNMTIHNAIAVSSVITEVNFLFFATVADRVK